LAFFLAQLALNLIWSVIFVGLRNPGGALIEIAVLWSAILATAIAFREVSRTAALLLLPYLAWVTFAAYLNYSIWSLN
jgi:benzodiazapine receptor